MVTAVSPYLGMLVPGDLSLGKENGGLMSLHGHLNAQQAIQGCVHGSCTVGTYRHGHGAEVCSYIANNIVAHCEDVAKHHAP